MTPAERKNKREEINGLTAALRIHLESDRWPLIGAVVDALEFLNSELDRREEALHDILRLSEYCLGPTRDVKTPKLRAIFEAAREALGEEE